jgi:NlpC/P60 family putative phage cell wall peptidase
MRIVAAARECLGTPFRHQGRLPGVALDCAGLVRHALVAAGAVDVPEVQGYGRAPDSDRLRQAVAGYLTQVGTWQPGDVLLMRFGREPQHLAIVTDRGIIHAYERVGKVCEHVLCPRWRARIVSAYRYV